MKRIYKVCVFKSKDARSHPELYDQSDWSDSFWGILHKFDKARRTTPPPCMITIRFAEIPEKIWDAACKLNDYSILDSFEFKSILIETFKPK